MDTSVMQDRVALHTLFARGELAEVRFGDFVGYAHIKHLDVPGFGSPSVTLSGDIPLTRRDPDTVQSGAFIEEWSIDLDPDSGDDDKPNTHTTIVPATPSPYFSPALAASIERLTASIMNSKAGQIAEAQWQQAREQHQLTIDQINQHAAHARSLQERIDASPPVTLHITFDFPPPEKVDRIIYNERGYIPDDVEPSYSPPRRAPPANVIATLASLLRLDEANTRDWLIVKISNHRGISEADAASELVAALG